MDVLVIHNHQNPKGKRQYMKKKTEYGKVLSVMVILFFPIKLNLLPEKPSNNKKEKVEYFMMHSTKYCKKSSFVLPDIFQETTIRSFFLCDMTYKYKAVVLVFSFGYPSCS